MSSDSQPGSQPSWRRVVQALAGYFFGRDVFISYARADVPEQYALRLVKALTARHITVDCDLFGSPPQSDVPAALLRRVRRSKVLALLASDAAMDSPNILKEVDEFLATRRSESVVPITFGTALPDGIVAARLHGIAFCVEQDAGGGKVIEPSLYVVDRIDGIRDYWRHNRRVFASGLAALSLLAAVAAISALVGRLALDQQTTAQALLLANDASLARTRAAASDTGWSDLWQRALLLSIEGLTLRRRPETESNLRTTVASLPQQLDLLPIQGPITGMQFSADGRYVVVRRRNVVETWDVGARARVDSARFPYVVADARLTPDGRLLVAVGPSDATQPTVEARNVELHTAAWTRQFPSTDGTPILAPDASRLIATSTDHKVLTIWDAHTGNTTGRASIPFWPDSLKFSPDGQRVAGIAFEEDRFFVVDLQTTRTTVSSSAIGGMQAIAFSPGADRIAVGSANEVELWSLVRGTLAITDTMVYHYDAGVDRLEFSADGRRLGVFGGGGVRVWDFSGRVRTEQSSGAGGKYLREVRLSGQYLGLVERFGLRIVDVATLQPIAFVPLDGTVMRPTALALEPNTMCLAVADSTGVRLFHTQTAVPGFTAERQDPFGFEGSFSGNYPADLSEDTRVATDRALRYAGVRNGATVTVWDVVDGRVVARLDSLKRVSTLANNDSFRLTARMDSTRIVIANTSRLSDTTTLTFPSESVLNGEGGSGIDSVSSTRRYVVVVQPRRESPGRQTTATPTHAETTAVRILDKETADTLVVRLPGAVRPLGFDGADRLLALADTTGALWIYDLDARRVTASITQTSRVLDATFTADGGRVATASAAGNVAIWNIRTIELESAIQQPWPATRVAFAPGDRWIVSVLSNGAVVPNLWRTEDLIASTCRWVFRPLRESERAPYSSRALQAGTGTGCTPAAPRTQRSPRTPIN